jgi:hypothetical protein
MLILNKQIFLFQEVGGNLFKDMEYIYFFIESFFYSILLSYISFLFFLQYCQPWKNLFNYYFVANSCPLKFQQFLDKLFSLIECYRGGFGYGLLLRTILIPRIFEE